IKAEFRGKGDIREILRSERRKTHLHTGEVDVPAGTEHAGRENFAADLVVLLGKHLHVHHAVVDEHGVADGDVVDKAVVVHVDGVGLLAHRATDGELHDVARLKI